jgi:hypothetical protein
MAIGISSIPSNIPPPSAEASAGAPPAPTDAAANAGAANAAAQPNASAPSTAPDAAAAAPPSDLRNVLPDSAVAPGILAQLKQAPADAPRLDAPSAKPTITNGGQIGFARYVPIAAADAPAPAQQARTAQKTVNLTPALKPGTVIAVVWNAKLSEGSVGHVFLGNANGDVLTSQFPRIHALNGTNVTKDWSYTLAAEGRLPDNVYKIQVSDIDGLNSQAFAERSRST